MKGFLLLTVTCFISTFIFCQDDPLLTFINKKIDEKNRTIKALQQELAKKQIEIDQLTRSKNSNEKKLKESIQEMLLNDLHLQKEQKELKNLQDEINQEKTKNIELIKKNQELTGRISELDSVIKKQAKQNNDVATKLQQQGRRSIYDEAEQDAELDFSKGRNEISRELFYYGEPFLILTTGYRAFDGPSFQARGGYSVNGDGNLFVGIGSGYDYSKKDYSLVPVYVSGMISLDDPFIHKPEKGKKEFDEYSIAYAFTDIGYSFLVSSKNQSIETGGWFTNIGIAGIFRIGANAAFTIGGSWRMQAISKYDLDGNIQNELLHSFDAKAGFFIYLGR